MRGFKVMHDVALDIYNLCLLSDILLQLWPTVVLTPSALIILAPISAAVTRVFWSLGRLTQVFNRAERVTES